MGEDAPDPVGGVAMLLRHERAQSADEHGAVEGHSDGDEQYPERVEQAVERAAGGVAHPVRIEPGGQGVDPLLDVLGEVGLGESRADDGEVLDLGEDLWQLVAELLRLADGGRTDDDGQEGDDSDQARRDDADRCAAVAPEAIVDESHERLYGEREQDSDPEQCDGTPHGSGECVEDEQRDDPDGQPDERAGIDGDEQARWGLATGARRDRSIALFAGHLGYRTTPMTSDGGMVAEPVVEDGNGPQTGRRLRLTIGPSAWTLAFAAVILALVVHGVAVRARQPLGWALAAIVAAAALELPIDTLNRRIKRRGLALLAVLIPVLAVIGVLTWAVVGDLDMQVRQLQRDIPEVAAEIEESDRFGDAAQDFGLVEWAEDFADGLRPPSSQIGEEAKTGASTWLLTLILTIFAVLWGRRLTDAGLAQISDERKRNKIARISRHAFERSQRYVDTSLVLGLATGLVAWVCFRLADLPAPTPLALFVGVASLVPLIGVAFAMWCAAGLAAGVVSPTAGITLALVALLVQAGHVFVLRKVAPAPRPGPAIIVISFIVGWVLYGVGGVIVTTALLVYAVAILDAIYEDEGEVIEETIA